MYIARLTETSYNGLRDSLHARRGSHYRFQCGSAGDQPVGGCLTRLFGRELEYPGDAGEVTFDWY